MTFAHYFLVVIDAAHTHISLHMVDVLNDTLSNKETKKGKKSKKPADAAVEKNEKNATNKAVNNFNEGIAFLLSGKYNLKGKAAKIIERSKVVKDEMSEADRTILAGKVFKLVQDVKAWQSSEAKTADEKTRKAKNAMFKKRIADLWKGSVKGGQGFGFELPKKDLGEEGN